MGVSGRPVSVEEMDAIRRGDVPGKTLVMSVPAADYLSRWTVITARGETRWSFQVTAARRANPTADDRSEWWARIDPRLADMPPVIHRYEEHAVLDAAMSAGAAYGWRLVSMVREGD